MSLSAEKAEVEKTANVLATKLNQRRFIDLAFSPPPSNQFQNANNEAFGADNVLVWAFKASSSIEDKRGIKVVPGVGLEPTSL